MHITVVIDRPRTGGAEVQTFSLMRHLAKLGHRIDLLCLHGEMGIDVPLPPEIPIVFLGFTRNFDVIAWRQLARHLNASPPDVIYGVNAMPIIMLGWAKALFGLKPAVVTSFHSTGFANRGEKNRFIMVRLALLALQVLVYVSENQRQYWRRRSVRAQRDTVIYNGIDIERFDSVSECQKMRARARLGIGPDEIVLVLCARFRPEKNHAQVVDAVRLLRAEGRLFTAIFVGDGPTRPSIEALVLEGGGDAYLHFVGEHKDVRPFLMASDLGVLTSKSVETFSLAALEAMAMGLPMVLSDIGGASEMVRPGQNGELFPVGDTDALVDRLRSLDEPERRRRMGHSARAIVRDRFTERQMVDQYIELFSSLAAR